MPISEDTILFILLGALVALVLLIIFLLWQALRPTKTDERSQPTARPKPGTTSKGKAPLLSVEGRDDAWTIRVRGRAYPRLAAITDERLRAEVQQAVAALMRFAGAQAPTRPSSPQPSAVASPSPRREPVRPVTPTPIAATPAGPSIDFAEEIGAIIDELLAADPTLTRHAIDLQNRIGGGLVFIVDGVIYHDLGEIPYDDAKDLIRRATREWERR